jgi:hypothetical protein
MPNMFGVKDQSQGAGRREGPSKSEWKEAKVTS